MHLNRKTQRKKIYDYSQPGYYAVTLCTQNRLCQFGDIKEGDMLLNTAGRMVTDTWHQIPQHYAGIELDIFQIMPNHIHGIIVINPVGVGPCAHPHPLTIRINGIRMKITFNRNQNRTNKSSTSPFRETALPRRS